MSTLLNPVAERLSHTAIKSVPSEIAARELAKKLEKEGFTSRHVDIIAPYTTRLGKKLEPEQRNIARTGVKAHVIFGLVGFIGALVLASILTGTGPAFAQANPYWTFIALATIGTFFGLMLGGFVTLRMDKDYLLMKVLRAQNKQQWTVVVHAEDRQKKALAKKLLSQV